MTYHHDPVMSVNPQSGHSTWIFLHPPWIFLLKGPNWFILTVVLTSNNKNPLTLFSLFAFLFLKNIKINSRIYLTNLEQEGKRLNNLILQ